MIAQISVIVCTRNSQRTLTDCLGSIKNQTIPVELVVVDNGSTDQSASIAARFAKKVINWGPERSAQRNRGVADAVGQYVLIIDSDMRLSPTVCQECVEILASQTEIRALVIPEASVGQGFWAQCKALERSFYVGVPWMEAARCFRKADFISVGGYDENNTGTEDFDLPQRLESQYGARCISRTVSPIDHDEGVISIFGSAKKKFYYAQRLSVYAAQKSNQQKFRLQSSPLRRYRLFFSEPTRLLRSPLIGLGMLTLKTTEMLAAAAGTLFPKVGFNMRDSIYK